MLRHQEYQVVIPDGCHAYTASVTVDNQTFKFSFDRGHCIPHADTQMLPGIDVTKLKDKQRLSTKDPENFVPQNKKFNRYIREQLEDYFRKKKLNYRDIAIYNRNNLYTVTINKKDKKGEKD